MKNSLLNHPQPQTLPSGKFSKRTRLFAILIAVFLPVPVISLPLVGLSFYAPLFFLVAFEAVFEPPRPWSSIDRKYFFLAVFIWVGIFLSAIVNGFTNDINSYGAITVFRFAYWIFIFVLVIYLVSVGEFAFTFVKIFPRSD